MDRKKFCEYGPGTLSKSHFKERVRVRESERTRDNRTITRKTCKNRNVENHFFPEEVEVKVGQFQLEKGERKHVNIFETSPFFQANIFKKKSFLFQILHKNSFKKTGSVLPPEPGNWQHPNRQE
jgi:hypothetical protein